jgi:hypothetical protein
MGVAQPQQERLGDSALDANLTNLLTGLFVDELLSATVKKKSTINNYDYFVADNYKSNPNRSICPDTYVARVTEPDLDQLRYPRIRYVVPVPPDDASFTPNVIDMVIAMINNRRNAFPVKERNKLSIMPLPFMQRVQESFIYRGRSGIFDLCLKSKSAIVNHLLKKEVVIIPFLHWNTQHYGCFVLFSKTTTRSKQMVLWDYAKQTTPLNRCQSRILIASFLCDF